MSKNKKQNRPKNSKSPNATIAYLLKKKTYIYRWIVSGLTIADVASKLGVSRSWLFEAFKENAELAAIRDDAYADRRDKLSSTLFQMALGNYTTRVRHTKTTKGTVTSYDDKGNVIKTDTVDTVVTNTDDTIQHIGDPNLKAITLIMNQMGNKDNKEQENVIEDTLDCNTDFTFADVAQDNDASEDLN